MTLCDTSGPTKLTFTHFYDNVDDSPLTIINLSMFGIPQCIIGWVEEVVPRDIPYDLYLIRVQKMSMVDIIIVNENNEYAFLTEPYGLTPRFREYYVKRYTMELFT